MYRDSGVGKGGYDVGEEIMVRVNDGGKIGRKMMSPERDITPLLGSKLPQLRLIRLPIYKVIDISVGVINHVYLFRGGATMAVKEKEGSLLPAGTAIFIGGAL